MLPTDLQERIDTWDPPARAALLVCRGLFCGIAEDRGLGPLDEALKWGQPAWRPRKPRIGSTLRMDWCPEHPDRLALFVDCKTDLAARMQTLYPKLPENDGRRALAVALNAPLPQQALSHLAEMTFTYHLAKRNA